MTSSAAAASLQRLVGALGLLLLASVWSAGAAAAQDDTGWQIDAFDVEMTVQPDGTVLVTETIAVDFRNLDRHGIFRAIPVRYDVAANDTQVHIPEGRRAEEYERVITIDDIEVTSTAPNDVQVEGPGVTGRFLRIRIGDEDLTVSGPQTYNITYSVTGALNAFETHDELYWNVTGNDWEVPILAASARVTAPAISETICFRGTFGATGRCDETTTDGATARFVSNNLQPGEGMTVGVSFPSDAVEVPPPTIEERWTVSRAFTGSPAAAPAAAAIGVLGLAGIGLLGYRQGRDRVTRGGVAVDGRLDAPVTRRRLFSGRVIPVEFRPPENLRPGQIGVLVDERVDPVDISATIVDLAVRGHLRIVEIEVKKFIGSRTDWELHRLEAPADDLLAYEQRLLDGLFSGRTQVKVSDLKGTFADDYDAVRKLLYADSVERKHFSSRPDSVRTRWLVLGILLTIFGFGGMILAVLITTWAIVLVPVFVLGIVLTIAHRWMPHRTAKGSQMLDKALGFRQFIASAEAGRAEYAEQQNLFIPYLPYAVVFGAVDKWAGTFAALAAAAGGTAGGAALGYWYVGPHPGYFDVNSFSSGLSDFSNTVGSSLPTAPASSSSSGGGGGFSGGGFGGGGGGSW